ncbi:uncharacterized protein LTHEOB_4878 [Lasiodiplodia theobromae]|uniref:uncharacterized protein n=1 Tax=Lasiodiplodia theobromae TaxID=45133 RepID=UPI0015C355A7|nr:uncharacterized protein LTHEOB_4878 [Lasiodiplodia theobromae]KAF4545619.1 hypothetical protein LTHEOB_4878 [Lasiodiplodia theobromae]
MQPSQRKAGGSRQDTSEHDNRSRKKRDSGTGLSGVRPRPSGNPWPEPPPAPSSNENRDATPHQTHAAGVATSTTNRYTTSPQTTHYETPLDKSQGHEAMPYIQEETYQQTTAGTNGSTASATGSLEHQQGNTTANWIWSEDYQQWYYIAQDPQTGASAIEEMEATDATNEQQPWWRRILRLLGIGSDIRMDDRYKDLKVKPIIAYADGYPQYAAFIDTDDNFRIYRRYGTLRNRVLLQRQLELALLEKKLDELDERDNNEPRKYRLASIQYDKEQGNSERVGLIEEIDRKLEQYDALLARERESLAMERPTKRNHLNLIHWVWNKRAIAKSEIELLNRIDDFVVLSRDQDSPFHTFLEDLLQRFPLSWIQRIFVSKIQQEKAEAISIFARPKHHELFAATAAYTAVLIVFLTNFSGSGVLTDVTFVLRKHSMLKFYRGNRNLMNRAFVLVATSKGPHLKRLGSRRPRNKMYKAI